MSRIGKNPVTIPAGVTVKVENNEIIVEGKLGKLVQPFSDVSIEVGAEDVVVSRPSDAKDHRAKHGLYRSLINNMVTGVSEQFKITLLLQGVGYRAAVQGKKIILNLGYSHQVELDIPTGITINVIKNTTVVLEGCDKEQLGLFASKIRAWRPPEPYKGKGIRYENEIVKRKAGKSGK